ncbi:33_t:CDS:2, partial [Gigaspora margarita]
KNHAGGIKDLYSKASSSFIPSDIPGNTYTPYLPSKLRRRSHDTIIYTICKYTELDFKGIYSLVESDNVSYLIPVEEAEPSALKDSTTIHNNQI